MFRIICSFILWAQASDSVAYIGPGLGLGAIAAAFSILGGLLLLVISFLYYPLKRMMKKRSKDKDVKNHSDDLSESRSAKNPKADFSINNPKVSSVNSRKQKQ